MEQLDRKETWGGLWSDYQSTISAAKEDEGSDLQSRWKAYRYVRCVLWIVAVWGKKDFPKWSVLEIEIILSLDDNSFWYNLF